MILKNDLKILPGNSFCFWIMNDSQVKSQTDLLTLERFIIIGKRDLRDNRRRHPTTAEPDRADPRWRGEEERVGAALDHAWIPRRRKTAIGQRGEIFRRRRCHAR